jgi:hypothetical protein
MIETIASCAQGWRAGPSSGRRIRVAVVLICASAVPLALMLAWRFSARRNAPGRGFVQCRFNSFGCLQCDLPEQTVGAADPQRILKWVIPAGVIALMLFCLANLDSGRDGE